MLRGSKWCICPASLVFVGVEEADQTAGLVAGVGGLRIGVGACE